MISIMMRDELIEGVNWFPVRDAQVIPASGAGRSLDARVLDKLDRALELMGRIEAARTRPIPDAPNAGPNAWELIAGEPPSLADMSRVSAEDMAHRCAEAEAAYAARNPHKKKEEAK